MISKVFLAICVYAVVHSDAVYGETWGNIYTTSLIDTINVHKYAIPLFVRETTVQFPTNYMEHGTHHERYVLHRIEHISHLESFRCSPNVRIISGGIHFPNATLEIRSKRGCGIDSTFEFYGLEQKQPYHNYDLKV